MYISWAMAAALTCPLLPVSSTSNGRSAIFMAASAASDLSFVRRRRRSSSHHLLYSTPISIVRGDIVFKVLVSTDSCLGEKKEKKFRICAIGSRKLGQAPDDRRRDEQCLVASHWFSCGGRTSERARRVVITDRHKHWLLLVGRQEQRSHSMWLEYQVSSYAHTNIIASFTRGSINRNRNNSRRTTANTGSRAEEEERKKPAGCCSKENRTT